MSKSRVIIVTGASRGMGKRMAEIILERSETAKVVLVARSEHLLKEFAESLSEKDQARVHYVAVDLTAEDASEKIVSETISKFGKVNSVIFNAGILEPIAHIDSLDTKQMRKLFEVNFFSLVELTQKLIPSLRQAAKEDGVPSGCVYVSSSASVFVYDGWLAYGASKAAVNHLAADLDSEEKGVIRSSSIDPGIVDTGMQVNIRENLGKGMNEDAHKAFIDFHASGQLLKPEVPGGVCALLALNGIPEEVSGKYLEYCDAALANFQY